MVGKSLKEQNNLMFGNENDLFIPLQINKSICKLLIIIVMANCVKKQASYSKSSIRPNFQWTQVSGILKTDQYGKQSKMQLKSNLTLDIQNTEGQQFRRKKLRRLIKIDLQKSLHYQSDVGWSWHKSSNLPNISIKVQLRDQQRDQPYYPPQGTFVRSFFVKMNVDNTDKQLNVCLEDVGIKGNSIASLKKGCGVLSGIRFLSTSYNNQGVRFFILLVFYMEDKQQKTHIDCNLPKGFSNNVISSLLSPPIFVDSRKAARDYHGKKFSSFVQLFQPLQTKRDLVLRKVKMNRNQPNDQKQYSESQDSVIIQNDLYGLHNYLTAPNIRNKVKHPLFLNIRFSNVFKLFFNTKYRHSLAIHSNHSILSRGQKREPIKQPQYNVKIQNIDNQKQQIALSSVINKFQRRLIKDIGMQRKTKKNLQFERKIFIIKIEAERTSALLRKICALLDFINCKSILIVDQDTKLGKQFVQFSELSSLKKQNGQKYTVLQTYDHNMGILQKILRQGIQNRNKKIQRQEDQQADIISCNQKRQQASYSKKNKKQKMHIKSIKKQKNIGNENFQRSECNYMNNSDDFFLNSQQIKHENAQNQMKIARILESSSDSEILPQNQYIRKHGQFNDINDFLDFNLPLAKEKPIEIKSKGENIQSWQQTIKTLNRVSEDKLIQQKVDMSIAAAGTNQATNLASKNIFSNSIATNSLDPTTKISQISRMGQTNQQMSQMNQISQMRRMIQMSQMSQMGKTNQIIQMSQMVQTNQIHPMGNDNIFNPLAISQHSLNNFLASRQCDSPNQKPTQTIKNQQCGRKQYSLNLPKKPTIRALIQGKGKFSNNFMKIDKINEEIHCLEIQNQINRQKIRNNEQLILSLRKQLEKDSKQALND